MDANAVTVQVQSSIHGKGVFARKNILKDAVLFKISGYRLNFQQTVLLGDKEGYALQTGIDYYIYPDEPFILTNHSCDPNCAVNDKYEFYALRDIAAGQELLWDYSTSMLERHWTMRCRCGAENCRKVIRDFDLLDLDLQKKYLDKKIAFPFIQTFMMHHKLRRA